MVRKPGVGCDDEGLGGMPIETSLASVEKTRSDEASRLLLGYDDSCCAACWASSAMAFSPSVWALTLMFRWPFLGRDDSAA